MSFLFLSSNRLLQTDYWPSYDRRPVWNTTKTMPNQHTAGPVDPSLADTTVTNTMVTNLATLRARMGSKGMANMVPAAGMGKDITSWASTYVPFEMISRMEERGAFCDAKL